MHAYDLTFSDGKTCRCIALEPDDDPGVDVAGIRSVFRDGYLVSIDRVIAPPPIKLPWKRAANDRWELNRFVLRKDGALWRLSWPGGGVYGDKDHVSAAVRENWTKGL